jgi:hypothetical protein
LFSFFSRRIAHEAQVIPAIPSSILLTAAAMMTLPSLRGVATTVLVEALLDRGVDGDLQEAQAAIDRLAAVPTEPGFVLHELPLLRLRALVAREQGDDAGCREFIQRYRAKAAAAGFDSPVDSTA